jgi:hypothetical protein
VTVTGLGTVDFAGLGVQLSIGDWVVDLIVTGAGICRDVDAVQFPGLADGSSVRFSGIVDPSQGQILRVLTSRVRPAIPCGY